MTEPHCFTLSRMNICSISWLAAAEQVPGEPATPVDQQQLAERLLAQAKEQGVELQAAMKCPYLTTRSLDPTGKGRARWVTRWKPALNAFAITFEGRIPTQ